MTSEVSIMNGECVVLAADSAATVDNGRTTKIFTTDKVFRLSDIQPIGPMVYGNADITGVPVSLIVQGYRDSLGGGSSAASRNAPRTSCPISVKVHR